MKNFLFIFLLCFIAAGCSAPAELKSVSPAKSEENVEAKNTSPAKSEEKLNVKTYQQMSDEEKNKFIADEFKEISGKFGQTDGSQVNEKGLALIKKYVDAYAKRNTEPKATEKCSFGSDLTTLLTRGKTYSQTIGDEFGKAGVHAQTGIYLAMIESEFCPCLQSPTGPLGIFQFTSATGTLYGLKAQKGATSQNPDDRCNPQLSAQAAAKYVQKLAAEDFGGQQKSVVYPLAIGAYNSGEGAVSANLKKALESKEALPNDVWTLIADSEKFSNQFQSENFKYIPKFFAAAIVGENPQIFGVNFAPLSESK